jgi:hypothetical protein
MEKPIGDLPVSSNSVKVPTKPYEIKTVKVQFSGMPQQTMAEQP